MAARTRQAERPVAERPTTAAQMFDARDEASRLENAISDRLLELCGLDSEWIDLPVGDVIFDSYDSSFEFKGVRPDWLPNQSQLDACFALGFARAWICYTDGTERYCVAGKTYELKRSASAPPSKD